MSTKNQKSTLTVEQRLDALERENAQLRQENSDMKSQRRGKSLGSAVLLRNKKDESKFILVSSILVDRDLHTRLGEEIARNESNPDIAVPVAQLDASMNQSNYNVHDRLDPVGVKNATSFWVDLTSDFNVELHSEHAERDPGSAYNMLDPDKENRGVSAEVQRARNAA